MYGNADGDVAAVPCAVHPIAVTTPIRYSSQLNCALERRHGVKEIGRALTAADWPSLEDLVIAVPDCGLASLGPVHVCSVCQLQQPSDLRTPATRRQRQA